MAQTFIDDVDFPEAPVMLGDGGLAFVEMGPDRGWIARVDADGGNKRTLAVTGRPNGLALDRHGRLWVAETAQRAVLRLDPDGTVTTIARGYRGEPFKFLNDIAIGPQGDVFVTDSGIEIEEAAPGGELSPAFRELEYDGCVYRVDPDNGDVTRVDRGIQFANGLAFGPDGDFYVAETLTGTIYRYPCRDGEVTGSREAFGNVVEHFDPAELKGPDGFKFGADGRLYACVFGQGDVTVLDGAGTVVDRLPTSGGMPTNLCFAGSGRIFVTEAETGTIQVLNVPTDGFTLYG